MASLNIVGGTADGRLRKTATAVAGWAACRAATPSVATTGTIYAVHRSLLAGTFYLDRAYFLFDVSPFQAGGAYASATITAVTLNLYFTEVQGTANFTIYYTDWGTSLAAGDWSAVLGTAATASTAPGAVGQKAITLINLASLLTANGRLEFTLTDETTEPTGANDIGIDQAEHTTPAYRPSITVTYTMPTNHGLMMMKCGQA